MLLKLTLTTLLLGTLCIIFLKAEDKPKPQAPPTVNHESLSSDEQLPIIRTSLEQLQAQEELNKVTQKYQKIVELQADYKEAKDRYDAAVKAANAATDKVL